MRTEILVGKTKRPATCQRCQQPIVVGELAAYYSTPPKGSAHARCHLAARRARA